MVSQTSPIFIPLISYLILGTKVTRWTKFSVVSGLVGIAFVLKPDGGIFNPWSLLGLLGGLTFGLSQVLYGINRTEQRNDVNLFFLFFIASTLSFVIYLITYGLTGGGGESGVEVIGSVPVAMWYVLFGMGLCTVGNQALKGLAYFYANPATLSPMIYITLIFAGVLDWIVFGKVPDGSSVIGAAIILMSVAIKLIFYHQAESKPSVLKRQR
ncbi:MAG: Riboflavin transporter [Chlamydiia bacterium]|nr:Riboflavin transporter [Chlamydiia bacterium]